MKRTKLIGLISAACLVLFYFLVFTPRVYTSEASVVIHKTTTSAATKDNMAAMMQAGVAYTETRMLKQIIYSSTMFEALDKQFALRKHYAQPLDPFWSISKKSTTDDTLKFYRDMVEIKIDDMSGFVTISVKTFDPALSQKVLARLLAISEESLNRAVSDVITGQFTFLKEQAGKARDEMEKARVEMLQFQDKSKLLTPQDSANAVLVSISRLEGDLVTKRAELSSSLSYLHPQSPDAIRIKSQINALEGQIALEKARLVGSGRQDRVSANASLYEKHKMQVEFAADLYKSALAIYEKAQYEAAKKSLAVVLVQPPTLPEEPSNPKLLRDIPITLFLGYLGLLLISLIIQVVREHR